MKKIENLFFYKLQMQKITLMRLVFGGDDEAALVIQSFSKMTVGSWIGLLKTQKNNTFPVHWIKHDEDEARTKTWTRKRMKTTTRMRIKTMM